ncbi:sacsin-like isoform X1 [Crassostrea virginica]
MDPFYCNICPQPNDATNQLIPFKGSVRSKYLVTTWTQHRILPSWTDTCSKDARIGLSDLGVQEPTPEISLTHIETVCNYLGNLTDKNLAKMNIERISRMMTTFYEYASKANVLQLINVQTFRKIPFVFLREIPGLFPCDRFTFQLDECYRMKPYLMEIPVEHYGFYKQFEQLGATKNVSSNTFAKILEDIHCVSENLNSNELRMAQRAMKFFFQLLPSENVSKMLETQDLFLLSKDCKLLNASNIVCMDSILYEKYLTHAEEHLCIMSEIDEMGSYVLKTKIEKLPKRMQLLLVSNLIEDKVDIENAQISENQITKDIKAFFESREFINGVLRMVYYEKSQLKQEFPSEENISTITENLCAVKFKCVGSMQIVYLLHGEEIGKKPCYSYLYTEEENGKKMWTVYLNFGVDNNLEMVVRKNQNLTSKAIKECTGCKFSSTESDLLGMLCAEVRNLDRIESILDDESIPPLDKKYKNASLPLPKPGDIVEIRWHCILDNDFISFEHGEYVAYISGINGRGDVEYKYAIIKEKLSCGDNSNFASLLQVYLVEIQPNEVKEMKVFKLFKFNRSKDSDGENRNVFMDFQREILHQQAAAEEEITDSQYCDVRSLEEIFREIREQLKHAFTLAEEERRALCRRIMRKWHPDKHPNDVTRATQIFQYIRKIIQKLEVGENIDVDDTQPEPENSRHPWSDEGFDEFDTTNEREKTNKERYRPRPPSSSGPQTRRPENTYTPDPQPFTANTWLDEAKYDIRFAKQSEDTMDENNENEFFSWICQMCHQATEKALIAWQYMEDAKRIGRSENLESLALSLPRDLQRLATDLENLTQGVRRMKYPDRTHIPSKAFTRDQAKRAMEIANEVIEKVDEHLQ